MPTAHTSAAASSRPITTPHSHECTRSESAFFRCRPQPGHVCTGTETTAPPPSACDDGPFGKGAGGEMVYSVTVPSNGSRWS